MRSAVVLWYAIVFYGRFLKKAPQKLSYGKFLAHIAGSTIVLRLLIVFRVVVGADPYNWYWLFRALDRYVQNR